jgi:SAM-dependent methyltransferase
MDKEKQKVADFWSSLQDWQFSEAVYWLANPILYSRYQEKATGGQEFDHWLEYCIQTFLGERTPVQAMLSVGCGTGLLDRRLARMKVCEQLDAIDIAPGAIGEAISEARQQGLQSIKYFVRDVEVDELPGDGYDAIVCNSALHHFVDLEGALDKLNASLAEGGYIFANEYVGPDRFRLSEREKEVIRSAFALLPERFRISLEPPSKDQILKSPSIPDPVEVERVDPSESPRSSEIPALLAERFEIIDRKQIGGTVLHFLLHKIAGHFRADDPDSIRMLKLLCMIEDTLMEIGDLGSHFCLIVARKRLRLGRKEIRRVREV